MAWTSPKTWSVAETLTAANMNTHVRDNENWLANDHPRCSAVRNSQSIPNATTTVISLTDTDEFDTGSMHNPASNASRITVPSGGGGIYRITGMVVWNTGASGTERFMGFQKNGVAITGASDSRSTTSSGNCGQGFSFEAQLVATDYIELIVNQTDGGALNVFGRLQLHWQAF